MEIWQFIWTLAFIFGFFSFCYISFRIITRGYAEIRSLLDQLKGS